MTTLAAAPPADALREVERCQLCGSRERSLRFEEAPWRVVQCGDCGLVYVTPRLHADALHEVYGDSYWRSDSPKTRGYADYAADAELYLETYRRRLALIAPFLPRHPARVLDVGCAAGYFLRVAAQAGHDPYGIELSEAIAHHAIEALGKDRVFVGYLDQVVARPDAAAVRRGGFDLITLWDVVEHVPDPQDFLRQVRDLLADDGVLVIETQNVDSRFARLLGRRWQHYKHQEHLYHFAPATIARLLGDVGFAIRHNTPRCGGKLVSFEFIAERAARLGRVAGWLARPLRLLGRRSIYLNFRDEMIVVAAKKHPAAT